MTTTRARGREAEVHAARFLERRGYVLVDENVHARFGELDVVAWDGDVLCFVEVRMRRSARHGRPAATVDARKQRKLALAAQRYITRLNPPLPACRFDVVELVGEERRVQLIRGAFEAAT